MSYLTKDYEISVWEDEWSGTTGFTEKKLAVIGSNTMTSQARVFSPQLVKNTNGTKTLTFKLYKKFIDNVTGEKVHNPFYDYLFAERKVKLKYKGEWHDFLVKNIVENSADYLYTYQLEDAFVHELSRNGFDVVFDEKTNNNIGTARELGSAALQGTDWTVESDLIIQTNEESLVYVELPAVGTMTNAVNILDSANMTETDVEFTPGLTVLAFYSSCTSKPRRFQFIYSNAHGAINSPYPKNSDRVITLADCQYYIDMSPDDYEQVEGTNFYLPKNWIIKTGIGASTGDSAPVSHLYRGARYNYGQCGQYHPGLDRYVTEWKDGAGNNGIFSYTKIEYKSPTFVKNYVVNSDLEHGSSGWYSADSDGKAAALSGVMGDFSGPNGLFRSVSDMDLTEFANTTKLNNLKSYLRVKGQTFYNTGLTDNRNILDFTPDDRLVVTGEFYDSYGNLLDYSKVIQPVPGIQGCQLVEAEISSNNIWQNITHSGIGFSFSSVDSDGIYFKPSSFTQEQLKDSRFTLKFNGTSSIYYARNIQVFKEVRDQAKRLIKPESQASSIDSSEIVSAKEVYFRGADQTTNGLNTTEEELIVIPKQDGFKPRYRSKAERAHAINVKESNYFNILQTIAETFGVWLKINVTHDDEGRVDSKGIRFVNYIGKKNYAGFRYGVNLKGIQRTQESKNIVTKLIVKPNNNQYGKNGFCTIAHAAGNETGETSIYNFQYYYNCGLLNEATITNYLYNANNEEVSDSNAKNYYGRLSKLNSEIRQWEEERSGIRLELVSLNADRYSQETIRDSAQSEMGDIARRFRVNYENEEISDLPSSEKFASSETAKQMYFEWARLQKVYSDASDKVDALGVDIDNREGIVKELEENIERNKRAKNTLHLAFYTEFYRFIREGTWMSEDYLDDDKYYIDAQSTLYNSCFPKATYQINVASLSGVEGYEGYEFEIGDETKIYDPEFFGTNEGIVIAVTETVEDLDDPTQASIKVQNFKNEFQDLFQKITATVQQTQYSTGAYHKAVEFVEADESTKLDFLGDAFNSDTATLSIGGQATVVQDASGISIIDKIDPYNALRLLGGKIMISRRDEQGKRYWATGMSSRGISADLITAGTINTGVLNIMSDGDPAFRWDTKGISAYSKTTESYDRTKFTRFDSFGFYGINDPSIDGQEWSPEDVSEISEKASFYLTWEGLRISTNAAALRIGRGADGTILQVTQPGAILPTFTISGNGDFTAYRGQIGGFRVGDINLKAEELLVQALFYGLTESSYGSKPLYVVNSETGFVLCPEGVKIKKRAEQEDKLWKILVGNNFGVMADGVVCANGARITGHIEATSGFFSDGVQFGNSFKLGPWGENKTSNPNNMWTALYTGNAIAINNPSDDPSIETSGVIWATTSAEETENSGGTTTSTAVSGFIQIRGQYDTGFYSQSMVELKHIRDNVQTDLQLRVGSGVARIILSDGGYSGNIYGSYYEKNVPSMTAESLVYELGINTPSFARSYLQGRSYGDVVSTITFGRANSSSEALVIEEMVTDPSTATTQYVSTFYDLVQVKNNLMINGTSEDDKAYLTFGAYADIANNGAAMVDASDERVKSSITDLSEKYSLLFDLLQPRLFQYNAGTSNRIHSGFIAQEVLQAIKGSSLTTKDFAAYVCDDAKDFCGLRYTEFIALNTWQIQKLKPRMTAAEQEIATLKQEIAELKSQLQKLQ